MGEKLNVLEDFYPLLHPKVATLVAVRGEDGSSNFMACAWCMPVSEEPPMVALAIGKGSYTLQLIQETREFTINIPTKDLLRAVWVAGTRSGRRTDKWKTAKLTPGNAREVQAPIIRECVAHLECRLVEMHEVGECVLLIAEVVAAYADNDLYEEYWKENTPLLLHVGGRYFTTPSRYFTPRRR